MKLWQKADHRLANTGRFIESSLGLKEGMMSVILVCVHLWWLCDKMPLWLCCIPIPPWVPIYLMDRCAGRTRVMWLAKGRKCQRASIWQMETDRVTKRGLAGWRRVDRAGVNMTQKFNIWVFFLYEHLISLILCVRVHSPLIWWCVES